MRRRRRRRCLGCGELFTARAQVKDQKYCRKALCQQEREKEYQKERRSHDPDYRANDADNRRAWAKQNPGYWRRYREKHPEYVKKNRQQQRERNKRRRGQKESRKVEVPPIVKKGPWTEMVWGGKKFAVWEIEKKCVAYGKSLKGKRLKRVWHVERVIATGGVWVGENQVAQELRRE